MPRRLSAMALTLVTLSLLNIPVLAGGIGRSLIINGGFTVKAGDARYWNFNVGGKGGTVTGRFKAEGGSGNDIECFILDPDSFENWRNGHRVRTYYNSGRITVANINVTLPAGNYVLVFNNRFSSVSNKAVNAVVELRW